jgi:hypothetical protein
VNKPLPIPIRRALPIRRLRLVRIPASRHPLWQDRHWVRDGNHFRGAFRTPLGSVAGEIILQDNTPSYYILNPPETLLKGGHGACFRPRGGGRYWVHFAVHTSGNIDAGILAVEALLVKAFRDLGREVPPT